MSRKDGCAKDFLLTLFNNNGKKTKVRERDAHNMMVTTFKDKDEDSDFSLRLVLSESQIKSWFSSEVGHRKKSGVNRIIEKGFTDLRAFPSEIEKTSNLNLDRN